MANQKHLDIIKQGVEAWNQWKHKNYLTHTDLSGANLAGVDLKYIHLSNVDLRGTIFVRQSLTFLS